MSIFGDIFIQTHSKWKKKNKQPVSELDMVSSV